MFSSTSSVTPFAISSFHYFPSPFSGFDANNVFLNNQLHDPFTSVVSTNPRIAESLTSMALLDNTTTMTNGDQYHGHSNSITNKKPAAPAKKDRHSKICTAQGLRDRRVRLSIDIAREFFDLQDMLGFDKASKTLEWLLSKSRKAIRELAENRNEAAKCLYSSISDHGTAVSRTRSSSGDKKEMKNHNKKDAFQVHPEKESRSKARARARQRTREKMCTRKVLHDRKKKGLNTSSQILTHLIKACAEPNSSNDQYFACNIQIEDPTSSSPALANQASEESSMPKWKWNPCSVFTHQQNLGISKDISGNSNHISSLPQNWDTTDGTVLITNMNMPTTGTVQRTITVLRFLDPLIWLRILILVANFQVFKAVADLGRPPTVNVNTNKCIMSFIDM